METIFAMKKGTEFPETFAGTNLTIQVPDAPSGDTDWDGFLAQVREYVDDAPTAHALFVSAFRLDRQKAAKAKAAEKDMTPTALQEWISGEGRKVGGRKLRGQGGGTAKPATGKQKVKTLGAEYRAILDDPSTPEAVKAFARERLAALGITTEENGSTEE